MLHLRAVAGFYYGACLDKTTDVASILYQKMAGNGSSKVLYSFHIVEMDNQKSGGGRELIVC
jgi:hypothetical protein